MRRGGGARHEPVGPDLARGHPRRRRAPRGEGVPHECLGGLVARAAAGHSAHVRCVRAGLCQNGVRERRRRPDDDDRRRVEPVELRGDDRGDAVRPGEQDPALLVDGGRRRAERLPRRGPRDEVDDGRVRPGGEGRAARGHGGGVPVGARHPADRGRGGGGAGGAGGRRPRRAPTSHRFRRGRRRPATLHPARGLQRSGRPWSIGVLAPRHLPLDPAGRHEAPPPIECRGRRGSRATVSANLAASPRDGRASAARSSTAARWSATLGLGPGSSAGRPTTAGARWPPGSRT